ncbi:ribosome biogenesis protein SLX9 homolog [Parasteatoda tepidariorum]|uniref:ribosome biogenesis protein SLX9 homolog n=1 Tax=Parasteatoda tepidariorum TaxID=114398 RepID=UPI00077FAAAB|nr:uncharacterized protein LOC107455035 [Parasteatoda tepidariorum]XP_015927917.1 uncharacterized protein LOC107455035 [Parasteatoda tepidariorum]XP_042898653.1 uncharacterized protein LOC107455035 [Parasteatoda tepidariorum]
MGKITDKKHRLHTAAPKTLTDNEVLHVTRNQWSQQSGIPSVSTNIFKNIHIPPSALKQQLQSFATQDAVEAKHAHRNATLALVASKLSAQKKKGAKREPVHKVIKNVLAEQVKKKKAQKKKSKTILQDYSSLKDALPDLVELRKECEAKEKPKIPKALKAQALKMSEDIKTFRSLMEDPTFVADPFAAISAHIKTHLSS